LVIDGNARTWRGFRTDSNRTPDVVDDVVGGVAAEKRSKRVFGVVGCDLDGVGDNVSRHALFDGGYIFYRYYELRRVLG